jgi:cobaltochelatase CobS
VRTSRTKEELLLCARSHGFAGWHELNLKASNTTRKPALTKWLANRGVTLDQVPTASQAARKMRDAVEPGSMLDKIEVQRMIDESLVGSGASVKSSVDMEEVRKLIAAEVMTAKPQKIIIDADSKPVKIEKHTHPLFEKVLRLVRSGMNVLLVGPAGCGKTTLAEQIAVALKRDYGSLHCTAGASEAQLTGWLLPIGKAGGAFEYVPSEFVRRYEEGNSVFLLDEIDAADPNMLLVINSALANGALHVPQRYKNPHVKRGEKVAIIAAANTYGSGADTMYAGRNQLDAATLDRFYVVEMGYDKALESTITGTESPVVAKWVQADKPEDSELAELGNWLNRLRNAVALHKLRRVVSTRSHQKAVVARNAGIPASEIKHDLLAGWTRDELIKVGED